MKANAKIVLRRRGACVCEALLISGWDGQVIARATGRSKNAARRALAMVVKGKE